MNPESDFLHLPASLKNPQLSMSTGNLPKKHAIPFYALHFDIREMDILHLIKNGYAIASTGHNSAEKPNDFHNEPT